MDKLKKIGRLVLRRAPGLRIRIRKIYGAVRAYRYKKISSGEAVDEKLVLFETFMGRQYACNPKAIYEYMLTDSRFDNYKPVWAFVDVEKAKAIPELKRAKIVKIYSEEYYETCARAGYIIANSNLENRITKKAGQTFVQTWHGTPLKKLRCDIETESGNANNSLEEIRYKNDEDVIRYDYFLSPSPFCTEKFISAFNLKNLNKENIVVETGYPRNDILFNCNQDKVRETKTRLGLPLDKKIILYAPTFRDNSHDGGGYVYDTKINLDKYREELQDDFIILFRAHYFVSNSFDFSRYEGFVYDMSQLDDITELYLITDLLITDYSSVCFDFANLGRPMLFYVYDLDEYEKDIRGFYFDINEIPGSKLRNDEDLLAEIKSIDKWVKSREYDDFINKFNPYEDGKSAKRVTDIIFGKQQ